MSPGDVVAVVGVGGIGANAIQGAKLAGAKQIWAIDPIESKREKAMEFGATHTAASMAEAMEPLGAASWGTWRHAQPWRLRPFALLLIATILGCATACDGQSAAGDTGSTTETPETSVAAAPELVGTQPPDPEPDPAIIELEATITEHRDGALQLIEQNGGCDEDFIERCILNTLEFIAPDSPAIEPVSQDLAQLEKQQLEDFYAGVAAAEEEKERELAEFYEGVKRAEAAQARADFAEDLARNRAKLAAAAKAEAIRIGEDLLTRQCYGNGGAFEYWTDPPGARVTRCNTPRQTSQGNGGRTGAICNDGWRSSATGSGACSGHGGVAYWTY